jgi:ferric-dicitrate binding protein FerR (iron transport regulator)
LSWIIRIKSGEATIVDAEQLMDWRATSTAHEEAFSDAVRCWRAIDRALQGSRTTTTVGQRRKKSKSRG